MKAQVIIAGFCLENVCKSMSLLHGMKGKLFFILSIPLVSNLFMPRKPWFYIRLHMQTGKLFKLGWS